MEVEVSADHDKQVNGQKKKICTRECVFTLVTLDFSASEPGKSFI